MKAIISLVNRVLDLLLITRAPCMVCGPSLDADTRLAGPRGRAVSLGKEPLSLTKAPVGLVFKSILVALGHSTITLLICAF